MLNCKYKRYIVSKDEFVDLINMYACIILYKKPLKVNYFLLFILGVFFTLTNATF